MSLSDAELTACLHRRARRVLLESLAVLSAMPITRRKGARTLDVEIVHRALLLAVLRFVVLSLGRARGLFQRAEDAAHGRLFAVEHALLDVQPIWRENALDWRFSEALAPARSSFDRELVAGLPQDGVDFEQCPAELVGNLYELLLAEKIELDGSGFRLASADRRKQTGTFFTPRALTEVVVERALAPLLLRSTPLTVCDPSVGGGAFLVQVGRALAGTSSERGALVRASLYGVDVNPVACAVAEAALCLFAADPSLSLAEAGRNVHAADALSLDFAAQFPEVFARGGFDLVIGNPPWVAYAGRAAKPLAPARKAYFAANYTASKGYPTLHGLFVECAARLTPGGTLALVVPSPIADLQGYRAVRRAVRARHAPREPMIEFGQDAFQSVTQPCFALIADARGELCEVDAEPERPFRLAERSRAAGTAAEVAPPSALARLAGLASFPRELFGEMGFQTTSRVTRELLLRAAEPDERHHYPLLEGRDVREFSEGGPRLFLAPDRELLVQARCRLRDANDYQRVKFVIRQTARFPIAARHAGLPFRNSLLAGFEYDGLEPDLVVGLLNSSLYRALHVAARRDARQAVFPQVKVSHLRSLPAPPADSEQCARIVRLSAQVTRDGLAPSLTEALDAAVFSLFGLEERAAREVREFLVSRTDSGRRAQPVLAKSDGS